MSYRRTLLFRWRRNDQLSVLVIAVTVAFLVGTVLFVFAVSTQTAAIAGELDSTGGATYHDTTAEADAAANPDALVLPVAPVTAPDGSRTYAVGVPPDADRDFGTRRLVGGPPTRGDLDAPATQTLEGRTTVSVDVTPRSGSILPPSWYSLAPGAVADLGTSGALVVDGSDGAETPLRGVLLFFVAGTEQMLAVVSLVAAAGALLVGITAFSTTRMTVADRREAIRIVRSTGGTSRTVLGLFGLRAGLVGGVGVALGYAIGVIVANAAVNIAVAVGLPTSLTVSISPEVAALLGALVAAMVAVTVIGGLLAARSAAIVPPAEVDRRAAAGEGLLSLRVLDRRALVPTAATLTAFLLVSSVFVAGGAVLAPLATTDQATVSQPGASHPVASQVPAGYADALAERDIDASGEILLFGVRNGEPVPMRGVEFDDYAAVSGATVVEGRRPRGPDEAVVGTKLGGDVAVGETITVGGSTRSAVTRVEVVGRFEADGADGAALLVSHRTARHLSGVRPGFVNVVRASRLPEPTGEGVVVTDAAPVEAAHAGAPLVVEISLANTAPSPANRTLTVDFADQRRAVPVALDAGETVRRRVEFAPVDPGSYELVAGEDRSTVRVLRADQRGFDAVPPAAPPGSNPAVRVVDATGTPAANVTVRAGETTRRTAADGTVRVSLNETGTVRLAAGEGPTAASANVTVSEGVPRRLSPTLEIAPQNPDVLVRPTATLTVRNPWSEPVDAAVELRGPAGRTTRQVTVGPGERRTVSRRLERQPPGSYEVTATIDGEPAAERTYEVRGDERIPAAVAASGREGSSPLGAAIEVAFGNLQLVAVALVGLAAAMSVGATTAAFAAAIRARRRELGIYRASGATPRRILRLVVGDALRVGLAATAVAAGLSGVGLLVLDRAGVLTVFGVRLLPALEPLFALGAVLAALAVVVVSATLATLAALRVPPAALVRERTTGGHVDD